MTNPMTLDERYALMKNCLQRLELYLSDPNPDLERCRKLIQSVLFQTQVPVVKERTLIPHINESDPVSQAMKQFAEIFKS